MPTTTVKHAKKAKHNSKTEVQPAPIDHLNSNLMRKALRLEEILKKYPLPD